MSSTVRTSNPPSAGIAPRGRERFELQALEYSHPYHWTPQIEDGSWRITQTLPWGLEYLGVLHAAREAILETRPDRVLDVGCGDGRLTYELLAAGVPQVTGVDPAIEAIDFARAFNRPFGDRVEIVCGTVEESSATRHDAAVAMEVLEHIPDEALPSLLEGVHTRLRPNAPFIVTVPSTVRPVIPKHERHYTEELLTAQLEPWFTIESMRSIHRVGKRENWLRRLMTNRLFHLSHAGLLRWATRHYLKRVLEATPRDGAHLLAVARAR